MLRLCEPKCQIADARMSNPLGQTNYFNSWICLLPLNWWLDLFLHICNLPLSAQFSSMAFVFHNIFNDKSPSKWQKTASKMKPWYLLCNTQDRLCHPNSIRYLYNRKTQTGRMISSMLVPHYRTRTDLQHAITNFKLTRLAHQTEHVARNSRQLSNW